MSKTQQANDAFAIFEQNVNSYFSNIEKSIPIFAQAITDLRQEYVQACENTVDSVVAIQKEFANSTGINVSVPDAVLSVITDVNKQVINANSVQNQVALASFNAVKQNIKTLNDNAKTFADLNKNIVQSWIQSFTLARNN